LYEGYSVVLLETLNYHKFCLCSDVAPLREVGKNFVEYINPHHPKEWAEKIISLLKDKKALKQKEDYIKKNWHTPTWKDSTQELYNYLSSLSVPAVLSNSDTPKVYYDLSLIFFKGGLSGIPRTEMLLARYLYRIRRDIIFFTLQKGKYIEIPSQKLSHLLSDEKLDSSVAEDMLHLTMLPSKELPFKNSDVVFSAGVGFDPKSFELVYEAHQKIGFTYCHVLYDLTPITVPHTHPQERVKVYPSYLHAIYALSDFIFYGGKTAQSDSEKYQKSTGLHPVRSEAVKWGSDIASSEDYKTSKEAVFTKYGIKGDFLLTVGTIEARKNQQVLYEAYLELLKIQHKGEKLPQLIICGHPGWKTASFMNILNTDSRIKNKVIFITPEDDELDILYRNCKFTLLASFYEGWSLTLPESLNYGKFCLTSDTPSLKETGEDIVDYANPYDPVEWAEKIKYYLKHPDELKKREVLIKQKWHNTTWLECAQNISKTLDKLLKEKKQ
ncbi:MAG: glycosyltransferase, partial [Pseudomonadota bacterium]|nr:glycosyltransferase [Pseudomonadota bacterium]